MPIPVNNGPQSDLRGHRLERSARRPIENELLYELMTYGDGRNKRWGLQNWNHGDPHARAILTFLATHAFDIRRLPWHHDRVFSSIPHDAYKLAPLLEQLCDRDTVDQACHELRQIHQHTVKVLRAAGISHVTLRRGVKDIEQKPWAIASEHRSGYATRLLLMATAASRLGHATFEVPADVLSSWSSGGYSFYAVTIERSVPIEDIAWCSDAIASFEAGCPERDAVEGGEWVILNRAANGRITLPVDAVVGHDLDPATLMVPNDRIDLEKLLTDLQVLYGPQSSMLRDISWPSGVRLTLVGRLRRAIAAFNEVTA